MAISPTKAHQGEVAANEVKNQQVNWWMLQEMDTAKNSTQHNGDQHLQGTSTLQEPN